MSWDKEAIYDAEISPLMSQIIAICKEHSLPMVAKFQIADHAEGGPFFCTTTLPFDGDKWIQDLAREMQPKRASLVAMAIISEGDG